MKIGGFIKQSLIDYPGNLSCTVFTQGCNFRCPYCHNAKLVLPSQFESSIEIRQIFNYLEKNRYLLDAVVISGGEPTLQHDLDSFIKEVRALNLKVKLDTNGTQPEILDKLLSQKLIDCVAMDIKTELDFSKYKKITGDKLTIEDFDKVLESISLIKQSGIEFEFRTTILRPYHNNQTPRKIKQQLGIQNNYKLNPFVPSEATIEQFSSPNYFQLEKMESQSIPV